MWWLWLLLLHPLPWMLMALATLSIIKVVTKLRKRQCEKNTR